MTINFRKEFELKTLESKKFLDINLEEMMFEYYLRKRNGLIKYSLKEYLKCLKRVPSGILNVVLKKAKIILNFKKEEIKNKIFFILTFSNSKDNNLNKINKILENLILKFDKKEIILIVFNERVYSEYINEGYNVLLIKVPKKNINLEFLTLNDFLYKRLDEKAFRLSRGIEIIKIADVIFKELKPKLVITTQDYYDEDYIFTKLAKKYKIPTITHLHGLILKTQENLGGYSYYYSDYIMLWGQRDVELLQKYLPNQKLIAVGSSKFRELLENRDKVKKYLTLCMTCLTSKPLKENEIINSFLLIKTNYEKVIKIHPGVNKKKFIKKYEKVLGATRVEKDYKFIEEAKYLLTYETTAIVDGLCCGASVLDIYTEEKDKNGELLEGLEESIVSVGFLNKEINKRDQDKEYFNKIMSKQEKVLKRIIYSFESEKIEKEIIDKILKEQEER